MKADPEKASYIHKPAFSTFAYSLLEDIMANATHPAQMSRQLVEQLRELTGARLVVLTRLQEMAEMHQLAAVEPKRRSPLAESPAMMTLAAMTRNLTGPTLWENGNAPPEVTPLLAKSLPGPAIAAPLQVGELQVGALLLFGLPHKHSLDQVIDMLGMLSRVVALVLRNAALFKDQEATIATRTRELTESEERLKVTLHSIGDAIIATDIQGKVALMNPVAEHLTGWKKSGAQGKPLDEVFHIINEDSRQPVENPATMAMRNGTVTGLANHTLLIARDGTIRPIADSGAPIRNARGEITGVALVFRDQTKERAAQKALQESEKKFRTLIEFSPVGIFLDDPDGNTIYINNRCAELVGVPAENALNLDWVPYIHKDDRARVTGCWANAVAKGIPFSEDYRWVHLDGQIVWTHGEIVPVRDNEGNILVFIGILIDITERKRVEETLQISLQEKIQLIQELYHRTKNNMQVIISMLMLQAGFTDQKWVHEMLQDTTSRIQAMALVHEKLYQSQNLSRINLDEYIRDLAQLLIRTYHVAPNKITPAFDLEQIPTLIDTAVPCGLVLNELISNVLKYAFPKKQNGLLKIALHRANNERFITLEVSDNGVGMPPNFDYKNSKTFGLQTVVAIVEYQLQGKIVFKTENGLTCRIQFQDDLYQERVKLE